MMESNREQEARSFFQIAQLELDRSLQGIEALVLGESPCEKGLVRLLIEAGARAEVSPLLSLPQKAYDLILLFCPIAPERLETLCQPNALVIDACPAQQEEWVVYDPALHYRRIRVLAIAGI